MHVESGAFTGLGSLTELPLSTKVYLVIYSGTSTGLENVTTLNMGGCMRLDYMFIIQSFSPNPSLPCLEVLDISIIGTVHVDFNIDDDFMTIFRNRPIKTLILREAVINILNLTDLQQVCNDIKQENVDFTDARFNSIKDMSDKVVCKTIKSLDLTGVTFPRTFISCIITEISNYSNEHIELNESIMAFLGSENVTLNRFCPEKHSQIWLINIKNVTIITSPMAFKRIKLCDSDIQVLDIDMIYASFDIEDLVLCNNSLQYVNH
ncbi:hypothetical protein DPMN_173053 [Dreissena polymorpha]|uniref:LRR containing protein n=1 Tax=Dreissena polymorpha TaxID=45954 RepID=A0A9D4IF55_DREPO|nr:hypothetical protein DPMN_173053 [Dreissena polymorpha]